MSQDDVMGTIQALAHEEHELREREGQGELSDRERDRLRSIEMQMDQCWDFLRQRRARHSAGLDPEEAHVRNIDSVEHYQQ